MEQILKVSAAEYMEHLRGSDCFNSPDGMEYTINYEIDGKQRTGGFNSRISAFGIAQSTARMLDIQVTVKRGDMITKIFHGRD